MNSGIGEAIEVWMTLDNVIKESQTTSFSTQRTVANTRKMCISVELIAVENGYNTLITHSTISYNRIKNNLSVHINIL